MTGMGTIVNAAAVAVGSSAGLLIKRGLKEELKDSVIKALGVCTMFIGLSGALTGLLKVTGGQLETSNTMLMILSVVIGTIIGELLKIETHIENMGERLKKAVKGGGDSRFVEGFLNSTLLICVGAMAIVGSLQDGLYNDPTMLYTKSILDGISTMIFASALGIGVLFSTLPLIVYQGGITLLAKAIAPVLSAAMIHDLSFIGSVLIFAVGVNLLFDRKIKVGNMLPALIVPIVYEIIVSHTGPLF